MKMQIKSAEMADVKAILSTLWIFVLFNVIFADIFSFMNPGFLQGLMTGNAEQVQITPELLLGFAVLTEIPIAMVLLSRIAKYRLNRWANIIAGAITILYIVGGGSTTPHYVFFASLEVACCLFIMWYAWKWRNTEG